MPRITGSPGPSHTVNPEQGSASPEAAGSPPATSRQHGHLSDLLPLARGVYEESRLYHGTSPAGRESIRTHGFKIAEKQPGAVAGYVRNQGGQLPPGDEAMAAQARRAHHLTAQKKLATQYAGAQLQGSALVRVLVPDPEAAGLRLDPFTNDARANEAYITEQDLPASSVLGSKNEQSASGSDVFQQRMNEVVEDSLPVSEEELAALGLNKNDLRPVTTEEAQALLNAVQSDSDEDFAPQRR